jgi:hypothetical protein
LFSVLLVVSSRQGHDALLLSDTHALDRLDAADRDHGSFEAHSFELAGDLGGQLLDRDRAQGADVDLGPVLGLAHLILHDLAPSAQR